MKFGTRHREPDRRGRVRRYERRPVQLGLSFDEGATDLQALRRAWWLSLAPLEEREFSPDVDGDDEYDEEKRAE
jgi:hypothetical protein